MIDPRSAVADEAVENLTAVTFQPPKLMTVEAREQAIADLRRAIFVSLPRADRAACLAAWAEARARLVDRAETRAWPLPVEVKKAFSESRRDSRPDGDDAKVEAFMVERLIVWFNKFGDCMPSCGKESRTVEMVRRGVLTWEEARIAGFPIPEAELNRILGRDGRGRAARVDARKMEQVGL